MEPAALCAELVRLPTALPHGTGEIIARCAQFLAPAGFRLACQFETAPGIRHALLERPGQGPALLFDAHVDTVPVGDEAQWSYPPLAGEIAGGKVWGRGSSDDKGPLAAALVALAQTSSPRHLLLSLCGDEETDMLGMQEMVRHPLVQAASQAVVLEPSDLVPVHAHKGNARVRVEVRGRACHASRPWEGQNAIEHKGRLIAALQDWFAREEAGRRLPEFGDDPPTLAVTREQTPNPAYNVIPDHALFWLNYRPLPLSHRLPEKGAGEAVRTPHDPFAALSDRILAIAQDLGIQGMVEVEFAVPPFLVPADSPLPVALARLSGNAPAWVAYGTHAGYLAGHIRDLAVFGPGRISVSHCRNECVEVGFLQQAAQVLSGLLEG